MKFKEKLKMFEELKEEKASKMIEIDELTPLLKLLEAHELDEITINSHEPYRDFSGCVVAGHQHKVVLKKGVLKRGVRNDMFSVLNDYIVTLDDRIKEIENEIVMLEESERYE